MKNLFIIILCWTLCNISIDVSAQVKNERILSKKELVGTWQKDSYRVGNGLSQNFQFFADGRFIFSNGSSGDDAVSTIKLKGRYRLRNDSLYFTITSKIIVDGELEIIDPGIDSGIFQYGSNSKQTDIKIAHPKEMAEPCFVSYLRRGKIKLNTEIYYKVIVQDDER